MVPQLRVFWSFVDVQMKTGGPITMIISLATNVLLFAIYSFGGWLLETMYASARKRRFINRGFLFGCFCPVYGFSAMLILHVSTRAGEYIAHPFQRILAIVVASTLLITGLEYTTGWVLEKTFKRKWWDYSESRWNLKGYVCLNYSLLWGGIAYVLVEVLHPIVIHGINVVSEGILVTLPWFIVFYFTIDTVASICKEYQAKISSYSQKDILTGNMDYLSCVMDLLSHEQVLRMEVFTHHGRTTCLKHCETVSYLSYNLCREWGWDYRAAARGGLLHDLFLYDWHVPDPRRKWHAFTHPQVALRHANSSFSLSDIEQDIIAKHMWPLTLFLPRYKESWIVSMIDKYVTLCEFFGAFEYRGMEKTKA
jgi:uncharacterized protein